MGRLAPLVSLHYTNGHQRRAATCWWGISNNVWKPVIWGGLQRDVRLQGRREGGESKLPMWGIWTLCNFLIILCFTFGFCCFVFFAPIWCLHLTACAAGWMWFTHLPPKLPHPRAASPSQHHKDSGEHKDLFDHRDAGSLFTFVVKMQIVFGKSCYLACLPETNLWPVLIICLPFCHSLPSNTLMLDYLPACLPRFSFNWCVEQKKSSLSEPGTVRTISV